MGDELLGGGDQHPAAADFQLEERVGLAVVIVRDPACELSGRGRAVAGGGVGVIVAAAVGVFVAVVPLLFLSKIVSFILLLF